MLKIALIGAPNSGKTELAQQLSHSLSNRDTVVVDDYIANVEDRSNVVLGHYATYLGNLQAAIGRFEHERNALKGIAEDAVVILCGSLVENAVYTATLAYITSQSSDGDAPFRMVSDRRANLCMTWLGVLRHDTWDYDLAYYLPLGDGDKWDKIVDQHIPEAAEALGVEFVELPTDREARVGIVLQEILEREAASPNELPGGIDPEENVSGDSTGHLPNVSEQT